MEQKQIDLLRSRLMMYKAEKKIPWYVVLDHLLSSEATSMAWPCPMPPRHAQPHYPRSSAGSSGQ